MAYEFSKWIGFCPLFDPMCIDLNEGYAFVFRALGCSSSRGKRLMVGIPPEVEIIGVRSFESFKCSRLSRRSCRQVPEQVHQWSLHLRKQLFLSCEESQASTQVSSC